jgi:protein phosphatase methylesterase 1
MYNLDYSLGGALAIRIANSKLIPNIHIVSAVDVVEGSSIDSLKFMQNILRGRPDKFVSEEKAIEWCVKSNSTKNLRAAKGIYVKSLKKK